MTDKKNRSDANPIELSDEDLEHAQGGGAKGSATNLNRPKPKGTVLTTNENILTNNENVEG